ncbi:glycine betaine ABC transporter substrate-binding protein [Desertibacillus haloalkaliphilus]|uniref:glycine betaine ABC transporter substrate-binding protein n=1 Tax=Desertibacillus haloalkaliphilus TaxID=1328930 RepID=UPI001C26B2A0|nr:glycine betaine ABC transporter substrate-binding protein [Desertibacillus haloalkaliphilus]MBU8906795.1 glycine betaine ABC transporter substrate-binding protein [Desertibacillus haloalkaliphilus]
MKKILQLSLLALILAVVAACGATEEGNTDSSSGDTTITFGVTPWSSTVPPTQVAKLILEDMGYSVEEVSADAGGVYAGLSRGDLDVFMDAWLPDMHKNYMEQFGDKLSSISVSYPDGDIGWVVPTYLEDINTVEDLIGIEDQFGNEFYGIEEGAGATMTSRELIEDYGLDMDHVSSSEGGMLAQASRQMANEEPVVFFGWRPHPMFVNYDLKVLEDTKGYFVASEVHVIANNDLEERAPDAYQFLSNWNIDVSDVEQMIIDIEDGMAPEEVAQAWIDENQDHVAEMIGE